MLQKADLLWAACPEGAGGPYFVFTPHIFQHKQPDQNEIEGQPEHLPFGIL
jgi:hypothetical protein